MKHITCTNAGVLSGYEAARAFHDRVPNMPGLTKLKAARIVAACRKEGAHVENVLNAITEKHIKRDTLGEPIPVVRNGMTLPNQYELIDVKAYQVDRAAVLAGEVTLFAPLLTARELEPLTIPQGVSIEDLLPFIEPEGEAPAPQA